MPTYTYYCENCGFSKEFKHHWTVMYSHFCPYCKKPMQRIFEPAPAIFKRGGTGARRNG
jgi:putative FmdB family regulatory protein